MHRLCAMLVNTNRVSPFKVCCVLQFSTSYPGQEFFVRLVDCVP
jgi:hypothetical protein